MKNDTHHNSISVFARLLATEDIRVRHLSTASTASFDVVNRVLTLPVWDNMNSNLYDMLVGHEVAHALHTPNDIDEERGCLACCSDIDPDAPQNVLPIINVVEDARIERLIKSKYPGLKRDFTIGYKSLYDMDIFELAQHGGVSKMGFLDRINLHFKLGILGIISVPIAEGTEQWFLNRIENATTFDEVTEISRDLYEYEMQKREEEEEKKKTMSNESSDEDSEDNEDSEDDGTEAETTPSNGNGSSEQQDEQQDENGDAPTNGSGAGASKGEDENIAGGPPPAIRSHTQEALDEKISEQAENSDRYLNERSITMPTPILENMIVKYPTIVEWWTNHMEKDRHGNERHPTSKKEVTENGGRCFEECDEWMRGEKSTVNNLVKQFEMRKAADEHRRTSIQKTGRLDTIKMINYKWSEDIFAKNQVISDGKNHGFVIVVDWSGSMQQNLESTVKQAITLAMFCRKANIPFELYAFSDRTCMVNTQCKWDDDYDRSKDVPYWGDIDVFPAQDPSDCGYEQRMTDLHMINFLSSSSNQREFVNSCRILYSVAIGEMFGGGPNRDWNPGRHGSARGLELGGTPLDEALTALHWILPEFRRRTNCQVLNTVILTDGDGNGSMYHGNVIRNPISRVEYGVHPTERQTGYDSTRPEDSVLLLLKSLKDSTGTNLIGMYLSTSKNPVKRGVSHNWIDYYNTSENTLNDLDKCYKKNRYFVAQGRYTKFFDEAYVMDANIEPEQEVNLPDSATHTQLRSAFVKGMKSRGMSRNLMNRFIEVVAR